MSGPASRLARSLLFSPGTRPELMAKAKAAGSDALIYDLEDSVPPAAKADARRNIAAALSEDAGPPTYVRVNHPAAGDTRQDIEALVEAARGSRLAGVVLPKAEHADAVALVADLLERVEKDAARGAAPLSIVPMIETCLGLRHAYDIARASPRVSGMVLASAEQGDFMVDLGGRWTPDARALAYPRSKLVCDARAAGIAWLIDGVFMNLADDAALRRESLLARELGFVAKMAIHPRQVPVIVEVFSPTAEEIDYARGLVAAFRAAEAAGTGAIAYRGMMVDYANLKLAERVLALAER